MARYLLLRNFISPDDQQLLINNAGGPVFNSPSGEASVGLDLKLPCHGGPLGNEIVVNMIKKVFIKAAEKYEDMGEFEISKQVVKPSISPLTGISLVYGPNGKMVAHHDSPIVPGRSYEWLAMITVGEAVQFTLGEEHLLLFSGDAMVMDAQSVLHGVDRVVHDPNKPELQGLPIDCRLGVLLWTAMEAPVKTDNHLRYDSNLEGFFGDSSDEE